MLIKASLQLREAYFEMCFHMGIVQIALDPRPPLSNRHQGALFRTLFCHLFLQCKKELKSAQTKCSDPPLNKKLGIWTWKKVLQTIRTSLYILPPPVNVLVNERD